MLALTIAGICTLVSIALLTVGGVLVGIHNVAQDADGYSTSDAGRFEHPSQAITSEGVRIGADPHDFLDEAADIISIRSNATPVAAGDSIFIGIACEADVGAYLNGVAHAEVRNIDFPPLRVDYLERSGEAAPSAPRTLSMWAVSAEGSGRQSFDWPLDHGTWTLVEMNADGSPGIDVELSVGAKIGVMLVIGIVLPVLGGLGLLVAIVIFYIAFRQPPSVARPPAVAISPPPPPAA